MVRRCGECVILTLLELCKGIMKDFIETRKIKVTLKQQV